MPSRSILAAFCCALLVCSFAAAQTPASATLLEIHATGSHRYNETQIATAAGLKPGDTVTKESLQMAADRLLKSGVFARVNYSFKSTGDKITLEFQLEDGPTIPVLFDNFPWFTEDELSAAVREVFPLFDGTAPPDGSVVDAITDSIAKLLPAKHVSGTVQHNVIAQPVSDGDLLQFRVAGPELNIASLEYGDALAQNSEALKDRNSDLLGKPFSRYSIEVFENEQVRPLYVAAGHLRVKFGEPVVHLPAGANAAAANTASDAGVQVTLPIDPGPAYHISSITWSGENAVSEALLNTILQQTTGTLAVADGMALRASWQRVEDEYMRRGYVDVKLDAQPQYDDANASVAYKVAITEGAQYRMGDLVITGLSLDAERLLRGVWRTPTGNVFDRTYVDEMVAKLEKPNTEIFGQLPVHYTKTGHFLRMDTNKHIVDVLLDFQ